MSETNAVYRVIDLGDVKLYLLIIHVRVYKFKYTKLLVKQALQKGHVLPTNKIMV